MKNQLTFKIPRQKHREHYVLFAEGTPFKQKIVKSKEVYKRKPKYVKGETFDN